MGLGVHEFILQESEGKGERRGQEGPRVVPSSRTWDEITTFACMWQSTRLLLLHHLSVE